MLTIKKTRNIDQLGYKHEVAVHENGFGTGVHTANHTESIWSEIKRLRGFYKGLNCDPEFIQVAATNIRIRKCNFEKGWWSIEVKLNWLESCIPYFGRIMPLLNNSFIILPHFLLLFYAQFVITNKKTKRKFGKFVLFITHQPKF